MPRLPSSLKWLVDRRGRVAGEIKKIERQLDKCRRMIDACDALDKDLAVIRQVLESVDETLALHEIQVEAALIPIIKSQEVEIRLPHGLLTRTILEFFRTAGSRIVSSREILPFVTKRLEDLGYPPIPRSSLAQRLKCRLRSMRAEGYLVRHHEPDTKEHGLWSLVDREFTLDIQIPGDAPDSTPERPGKYRH